MICLSGELKAELLLLSFSALHTIKTIIKLFSTARLRVSSRACGWAEGIDGVWNRGMMFSQLARGSTRALVSGIFKRLRTFVGVIDVLNGFPKIGNVFFLCRVRCQHQLKLYSVSRRIDKGVGASSSNCARTTQPLFYWPRIISKSFVVEFLRYEIFVKADNELFKEFKFSFLRTGNRNGAHFVKSYLSSLVSLVPLPTVLLK